MFQRTFLTGLAVTLLVVQACGSDDGKKRSLSAEAGAGGEAGAVEGPDSGGSSAGEPPGMAGGQPTEPSGGSGGTGEAGTGGQAPLPPDPELLFTVANGSDGLPDTAIAAQAHAGNVIYTSSSGSQDEINGDNAIKIVGADLGLAESDSIVSFTLLQAKPQHPMYLFSVADGSEGASPTSVNEEYWTSGEEEGDVYFSDGVESYRWLGEGGDDHGYNGLLASEVSLGLSPGIDENFPDELRGLLVHDANKPITELYFAVDGDAAGLADSTVEATPVAERGCTVFKSELDGTNSVAFSCADLGLIAGDEVDALLVYGNRTPSELVFSVSYNSQGALSSAVETAVAADSDPGATLFRSTGDGSNTLFMSPRELGLGYEYQQDEIDGLAVVEAPQASVPHAATCNITYDPFDVADGGELTSFGGSSHIGQNILVMFGATDAGSRLLAYNATTCAFLQQKDMPGAFSTRYGWAIVPLAGWSPATPLDAVEYLRVEHNTQTYTKELNRFDTAGAFVSAIPINDSDYYATAATLVYEPVGDQLYLLSDDGFINLQFQLSVMPRPAAAATEVTAVSRRLPLPCTNDASIAGTDPAGNLYVAQLQGNGTDYRVCAYSPTGNMLPSPYWWTPEGPIEQSGFIVGGGPHYLLSTNFGVGPSAIERGAYSPP